MLARVLLLAAVVIWGWTFVATKILLEELGPVEILGLRLAIGVPFLGIVLLVKGVPLRVTGGDARAIILAGAILTFHFLLQIVGLSGTTATNSGWIITFSPLAVVVVSFLFLRERIGRRGVAGIAVATAGILLLVSRGRLADFEWLRSTGDWLILASAFTWALYTVATRDLARRRDPLTVAFGILLVAALLTAGLFAASANLQSVRTLSRRRSLPLSRTACDRCARRAAARRAVHGSHRAWRRVRARRRVRRPAGAIIGCVTGI